MDNFLTRLNSRAISPNHHLNKLIDVNSWNDLVLVTLIEGKDATDDFEDAGHSNDARELMKSFCIGELDMSSPAIPELKISDKKQQTDVAQKLLNLTKQYWAVSVAIVGISVVAGFLFMRKK